MPVTQTRSRRGISMGARVLIFSSLFLIALLWLGFRYIDQMKDFLLQGQEEAQLLSARALATVLHGRTELFYPLDQPADPATEERALYVYPLDSPIEIDAYASDWGDLRQQAKRFGTDSLFDSRNGNSVQPLSFSLLLGEYGKTIYALVRVADEHIVYRHPQYRRLDHSDHVRVELINAVAERKRFILITEGEGQVSVYEMNPDWETAVSGQPVYALSGFWREHSGGYDVELRIPAAWFGAQPEMAVSVASVDNADERTIGTIAATYGPGAEDKLNRLITRSPELDRILQGLESADTTICVIDSYRRVRGVYGASEETSLCSQIEAVSGELVASALNGLPSALRHQSARGETLILAIHPVYAGEEVLGAVLVEKSSAHILGLQRESLLEILGATSIVFVIAIVSLMLFAAWLAYRIRRLQREASRAIDADGRVNTDHIRTDELAADEIGQLSRNISSLLFRLKSYTGFLESIPRTLRHEILNPVNTISMSLQKIDAGDNAESVINSARKAVQQLELIVHGLTEAAHIDAALTHDDVVRFDIAALAKEYVHNSKLKHGNARFDFKGHGSGLYVVGSDLRIAQLLDKLKDNALDFSPACSVVVIQVTAHQNTVELSVMNQGPAIPQEVLEASFHGMISRRPDTNSRPHLGIGLYIANRIARQHGGHLQLRNRPNEQGVSVSLNLPLDL